MCVHEKDELCAWGSASGARRSSLLICNQVRQTAQPHTPLSPPSRLPSLFFSLLSPSLTSISSSPHTPHYPLLPALLLCFPQHQWNSTFCQELDISIISLVILSTFLFASPAHSVFLSPLLPFFFCLCSPASYISIFNLPLNISSSPRLPSFLNVLTYSQNTDSTILTRVLRWQYFVVFASAFLCECVLGRLFLTHKALVLLPSAVIFGR